jgi:hypothetical protein
MEQQPQRGGTVAWALPQARLQHFLGLLGGAVARYCQARLRSFDLWRSAFGQARPQLIGASQLLAAWAKVRRAGSSGCGMRVRGLPRAWTLAIT